MFRKKMLLGAKKWDIFMSDDGSTSELDKFAPFAFANQGCRAKDCPNGFVKDIFQSPGG